jgi:anti-anti-sigma factor
MDRIWAVGERVEIDNLKAPRAAGVKVYADRQLVVSRTSSPAGIKFTGEMDASNSHAVGSSIAVAMIPDQDLHVDVSDLQFCDISGIRALVAAAEGLNQGRGLLLHGMPPQLKTVIKVVGWSRLPTLVVCECEVDPE